MECVLKELIGVSKDGEWGKSEPFDNSVEMLAIRGTDFEDVRFGNTAPVPRRHVPKRIAEKKTLQPWDVVIETAGGTKNQITGRTVLLRPQLFSRSELTFTCASFSRFIRFNTELCDPEFMFWYLQHLYASGLMHAYHTQHTGVARFQWTTFSELEPLELPPLPIQHRIAGILSAYDGLIENNLRRIQILEEMARTVYREWFVNFRFPGHESVSRVESPLGSIPEGWEVKPIVDLCESVSYGFTASATRDRSGPKFLRITDIVPEVIDWDDVPFCEISSEKSPKYLLEPGDIVVARTGATTGFAKRLNKRHPLSVFASYLVRVRTKGGVSNRMLGILMESDEYKQFIKANIGGAAQPQANAIVLTSMRVIVPPSKLAREFDRLVESFLDEIELLAVRNRNLRRTRDLLLPRLLSGIIDLSDAVDPSSFSREIGTPDEPVTQTQERFDTATIATKESPSSEKTLPTAVSVGMSRDRSAQEPPGNQFELGYELPPSIDQTDRSDVLAVIRHVFSDGQTRNRQHAIREVARALGYGRVGHRIQDVLHTDLLTAVRRGILVCCP
jgi:type I restriction enzyme S subunit